MSTIDYSALRSPSDIDAQAADMAAALQALKPNARCIKSQLFSRLYPVIADRLKASVTQKAILEMLEAHGLKLHPARFKELMEMEAKASCCPTDSNTNDESSAK